MYSKIKNYAGLFLVVIFVMTLLLAQGVIVCAADSDELVYYYPGNKQADADLVHKKFNEMLAERGMDFTVDFRRLDYGQYDQKMNLVIASGEKFDLCFTSDWTNKFYQNVSKGAFLPIGDLINEHAPELKQELPEFVWGPVTVKGKIYGVPNYQVMYVNWAFVIQKKVADKLGITEEKINKYEDIEKFLPQIKKEFPDLYPIDPSTAFFLFKFEDLAGVAHTVIDEPGYKVYPGGTHWPDNDFNRKWELKFREWWQKGYIRKDEALVEDDSADKDAGKYAVWQARYKPTAQSEMQNSFDFDIVMIPFGTPYIPMNAGTSTLTAVSRTSEHPEKAIKLIELLNTDEELYRLLCHGIEGVHYEKIGEETIEHVKDSKYNPNSSWMFGNVFKDFLLKGQSKEDYAETERLNKNAKASKLRGFVPDLSPIKTEIARVKAVLSDYPGPFIYEDKEKLLAAYDRLYEKAYSAGLNEIVDELQNQVDKWVEENK